MKKIILIGSILLSSKQIKSQLSGILNVPSNYTSVASVITAMNQLGVSGPLTLNIAANYTETVPQNGYSLTATGSATSPVVFKKNGVGANPLLIAYSGGSGTPGTMNQDGIWRFIGCDYITIDGIDLTDPNINNPATMEFGFGFFKVNASNGCQNNTIKNCVITLNRVNNAGGTGPATDGSRGIDVVNAASNVHNSAISVTSSQGSHSNNKFYANSIRNCNVGISMIGFVDISPFSFADTGNDVGGNSISTGNTIIDFGGGGSANSAAGIRSQAQYNLNVSFNMVNNNSGSGINHPVILRGIHLNAAASADVTIHNNTLTLQGGGTSSQLSVIENLSGSTASSNTVSIQNNLIVNCTYMSSTSGPFYGIWNTASPDVLAISGNSFVNNSTYAASGSTYLIYNNGAVASRVNLDNNNFGFTYNGTAPYTGNMFSLYNGNGTPATLLNIQNNNFLNYNYAAFTGSGSLYFIFNTNDSYGLTIDNNTWTNLSLNHSGSQYLINNNSATQSSLSVSGNSINGTYNRSASAGATYLYYATGSSPSGCVQTLTGNNFSNITATVAGTGNFYGLYNSDGANSPYPKKIISANTISNVNINSTGTFYGYFMDNLGDGNSTVGSSVFNNTLSSVSRAGVIYGLYVSGTVSPNYVPKVYGNSVLNLNSSGPSSNLYAVYLVGGGTGLNFYKNKISEIKETGSTGIAHGIYVASAINTTLANNFVGHINAPNSFGSNAVNGVFINGGTLVNAFYNTVYLNAVSLGGNFNSNSIYASTTTSLSLRNNIFINLSLGGTGVAAAYRRSSTSLTNYLSSSNNNLFYAGVPSSNNILLHSGTTAYQSLSGFQTAVSPRDLNSVSQNVSFLSTSAASANYLHVVPNVSSLLESAAVNISGVNDDYDHQIRQGNPGYIGSGSAPDIGADEFNQNLNPCSSANAGTTSTTSIALCAGQAASLIANGYTPGTGLTHQWKFSTVSGGPFFNVTGGNGSTTPEFISASLVTGTYYFVMSTTCTNVSVSAVSAEATVVIHPVPLTSASISSSLLCVGQVINFTGLASSATNFQWVGPNGFNSVLQNPQITKAVTNSSGVYYFSVSANGCTSSQSSVSLLVSGVTLSVSASPNVMCLGSVATISLNSSALTYTWSNGSNANSFTVAPVANSVYSVTVTNTANCSSSGALTVSVINPSISANTSFACGAAANVTLSVIAFTPSLINWFASPTSINSIGTGINYTQTIANSATFYAEASNSLSGCQSVRIPVTVTLTPYPTLNALASPSVVCPGRQSTLTVSGAATYSFVSIGSGSMHVVSPLSNRIYTVIGKSSLGCSSTETLLVNTYSVAIISTAQTASSICPSGVVTLSASGASSYFWNTGTSGPITTVTPAINSTYTVYGTNTQSCTSTRTLAITTRSVPLISISQSTNEVCPGAIVTFTASGAGSYTWLPGNSISITFSATPFVSSVYNAIGKSINTCTNVAIANVLVNPCTGLKQFIMNENIVNLFPNPTEGIINVKFNSKEERQIKIVSSLGGIVYETSISESSEVINLSGLKKGIYFVQITDSKKMVTQKVVVK